MTLISELSHRAARRGRRWLMVLLLLTLITAAISLCAGESWIAPGDWFSPQGQLFVWQLRLPRFL